MPYTNSPCHIRLNFCWITQYNKMRLTEILRLLVNYAWCYRKFVFVSPLDLTGKCLITKMSTINLCVPQPQSNILSISLLCLYITCLCSLLWYWLWWLMMIIHRISPTHIVNKRFNESTNKINYEPVIGVAFTKSR